MDANGNPHHRIYLDDGRTIYTSTDYGAMNGLNTTPNRMTRKKDL